MRLPAKVVVGIGNPDREYEGTRHNVGFEVVELLAKRRGWRFRAKGGDLRLAGGDFAGEGVLLAKPLTYVNRTGIIMPRLRDASGDPERNLMIVCDDIALPVGRLRIRPRGRSGGHKGIDSVIGALGSDVFPRLRVGVGRDPEKNAADYVLSPFSSVEREVMDRAFESAADAVELWIEKGLEPAMNRYNPAETSS